MNSHFIQVPAWIACVLLLLPLHGCGSLRTPVPAPSQPGWSVARIALPRVTYGDAGPDRFCEPYIYDEVWWQVSRALKRKGYTVVAAAMPAKENSNRPDPWATAGSGQLLGLLPPDADALLRVRIDHYQSLDLCSGERTRILEMAGTAELFQPGRSDPIWSSRDRARFTSISRADNLPFMVGSELADRLLRDLPPARH